MAHFPGSCGFVFDKALAKRKANYEAGGKLISYVVPCKKLTAWRNGSKAPWLQDAPAYQT